jgi:hypothetical protein
MNPDRSGQSALAAGLMMFALLSGCAPSTASDAKAINALMRQTWDRADNPIQLGPTAIVGDTAVADWTQGKMGGRALLERRSGRWTVVLCAGETIRTQHGLSQVGLKPRVARAIAQKLSVAEREVSADRLALMAGFQGVVSMAPDQP